MSILTQVLQSGVIQKISAQVNEPEDKVKTIVEEGGGTILSSIQSQLKGASPTSGIMQALKNHSGADLSDVPGMISSIDMKDGAKMLHHILGDQTGDLETGLSNKTGVSKNSVNQILSTIAPILMKFLGDNILKGGDLMGTVSSALGGLFGKK